MEEKRKNLKIWSIVILVFAALSLTKAITTLILTKFDPATLPEGTTEVLFTISKFILFGITCVLLLPRIYVGFKGLKAASTPVSTKGHITWAMILLVLVALTAISPISNLIQAKDIFKNIGSLASTVLEVVVFFEYITCAKAVAKEV